MSFDTSETKNVKLSILFLIRALIRDLSRVLRLLNTKPGKLEMPNDGVPLLLWAENALKRFDLQVRMKYTSTRSLPAVLLLDSYRRALDASIMKIITNVFFHHKIKITY